MFGQIKPYKGVDVLIDAFARLPEALRAKARMRVVGKPFMDVAPLVELARQRGVASQLEFEPRFAADEEIPALFGPDSIAVLPYREIEGSGVLTVAIANGRPIIASRIGCFAEDLEDGVHGVLVPPDDPAALTVAMERMLTDPGFATRCAANVRALSAEVPSWDEIGRRTAAVYLAALEERRPGVPGRPAPSRPGNTRRFDPACGWRRSRHVYFCCRIRARSGDFYCVPPARDGPSERQSRPLWLPHRKTWFVTLVVPGTWSRDIVVTRSVLCPSIM